MISKYKYKKIKNNSFYIPQGLFKFLPKYDFLIGQILRQNKDSSVYFIKDKDPFYTNKFIQRLRKIKNIDQNFNRVNFLDSMVKSLIIRSSQIIKSF